MQRYYSPKAAIRALRSLLRDQRGNVLLLAAALLIPLMGLIGGGIDIARGQLAQSRLQQACDAAALAGRRAMTAGSVDATVRAEAIKFFNFNFPQGAYRTAIFTPTVTSPSGAAQTVVVTASTSIPMSLMKFFGYSTMPLSVTCNAKQDFVNTEIVLVLDTTGSMADKAVNTDTDTKIVALRKAVLAFYDQLAPIQTQLAAANLRLRYGIVPYASSINVGAAIRGVDQNYMASTTWNYQSRQVLTTPQPVSSSTCTNSYNGTWAQTGSVTTGSGWSQQTTLVGTCSYFGYGGQGQPISVDISKYVTGAAVDISPMIGTANAAGRPGTLVTKNTTWAGCIEERQTVQMASTATSIPTGAYDLDIDRIPTAGDDTTKWKPYWPEIEFGPTTKTQPQVACPIAAARMQVWARADLSTYLNKLNPDGGTYHDNGMMWGARWASPNGIFGPDNPSTYGGMPVKRFIIFMTDGLFDTGYDALYTTYGIEKFDARVTPGGSASNETDQLARHQNRFNLLCAKAKTMGYSIWVVAFAQALDTNLTNCASNANQASTAANSAALTAQFTVIGQNIGALRLSQ